MANFAYAVWRGWMRQGAVVCALLLVSGCSILKPQAAPPPSPDPYADIRPAAASVGVVMPDRKDFLHPWDISTYVMRVTLFASLPIMNGGVAFVGDSLTDYGRWPEAYPNLRVRNFGVAGDTTVGLQHRISQVVEAKPATIFLMIGTNDVEFGRSPEQIAGNVVDIVDKLTSGLPGVKIYVESLLPRQPEFDGKIRAVNTLLIELARTRGVTYVDLYPHFVANGRLDPKLTNDDIHLAGAGYALWREAIFDVISASEKRQ